MADDAEPDDLVLPPEEEAAADVIDCAIRGHRFRKPDLRVCIRCGFEAPGVPPLVSRGNKVYWTPQMDAKLLRCRAEGLPFDMAAIEVGVGVEACRYRVWSLSCRPAVVAMRLLLDVAADSGGTADMSEDAP